jgi:hypothetical protein
MLETIYEVDENIFTDDDDDDDDSSKFINQ